MIGVGLQKKKEHGSGGFCFLDFLGALGKEMGGNTKWELFANGWWEKNSKTVWDAYRISPGFTASFLSVSCLPFMFVPFSCFCFPFFFLYSGAVLLRIPPPFLSLVQHMLKNCDEWVTEEEEMAVLGALALGWHQKG